MLFNFPLCLFRLVSYLSFIMSKQIFNFPIPDLCQRADQMVYSYNRDKKEFINYGFNSTTLTAINVKTESLKHFPSDDHYGGLQRLSTYNKNQIRVITEAHIIDLRTRIKLAIDVKSVEYSLFRFNRLSHIGDNELVQYVLHVVNTAQPMLDRLSRRLVKQVTLDKMMELRQQLDDAIDKQSTAVSERSEKKAKRNILANELYTLLSELSDVGKMIWKNKNEAFYTDYVIYGSSKLMDEGESGNKVQGER